MIRQTPAATPMITGMLRGKDDDVDDDALAEVVVVGDREEPSGGGGVSAGGRGVMTAGGGLSVCTGGGDVERELGDSATPGGRYEGCLGLMRGGLTRVSSGAGAGAGTTAGMPPLYGGSPGHGCKIRGAR